MRRRGHTATLTLSVALLSAGCASQGAEAIACPLDDNGQHAVTVLVESRVSGDRLSGGRAAVCGDGPAAQALLARARRMRDRIDPPLRPQRVDVHLVAAGRGLEYHRRGHALLASPDAVQLHDSVWLHELAHVRMGRSPRGDGFARAWQEALEEGIADYHAAAVSGQPQLGPFGNRRRSKRDLARAPPVAAGDWESLALPNVDFDPHRLGWSFAGAAWRAEPRSGELLADLLACGEQPVPSHWLQSCPVRSRARIEALLRGWMPAELLR